MNGSIKKNFLLILTIVTTFILASCGQNFMADRRSHGELPPHNDYFDPDPSPSPVVRVTPTPTPSPNSTPVPSSSPSPSPSSSPLPSPSPIPSPLPSPSPSPSPSPIPSPSPSPTPPPNIQPGRWTSGNFQYPYQIYAPATIQAGRSYPLVVNLHGAGTTNPVSQVPSKYFAGHGQTVELHFILSPTSTGSWDAQMVKLLVDRIISSYPIDTNRIYGTGQSMGGFGTGKVANAYPDLYAAIVPVAGIVWPVNEAAQQTALYAPKIARIPYWGFHGAKDPTVPVETHRNFVKALQANNGNPKYTEFPDGVHNIWNPGGQNLVYINSVGVAEWLFSQRK